MKQNIFFLLFFIIFISDVKAELFKNHKDEMVTSETLLQQNKKLAKCRQELLEKHGDKFYEFIDDYTCRKTTDPIDHCYCMNRLTSNMTEEDSKRIAEELETALNYDTKKIAHQGDEVNSLLNIAGILKLSSSGQAAPELIKSCEEATQSIQDKGCKITHQRFARQVENIKSTLKNMPQSGKWASTLPVERMEKHYNDQVHYLHKLFIVATQKGIDFSKFTTFTGLLEELQIDPLVDRDAKVLKEYGELSRYLIDKGRNPESIQNIRFKKLMIALRENRNLIAKIGEKINQHTDHLSADHSAIDIADGEGHQLFSKAVANFFENDLKVKCEEAFKKNAVHYCEREKKDYEEKISKLTLDPATYEELLKNAKTSNHSLAQLAVEGFYCSNLTAEVTKNKDLINVSELPPNCDTQLCKLIKQRLASGISLEDIQIELAHIAKMPKVYEKKTIPKVADKSNETNLPGGPVKSSDIDKKSAPVQLDMAEIYAKAGYKKEHVEKAKLEVIKSHPEILKPFQEKKASLAADNSGTEIAQRSEHTSTKVQALGPASQQMTSSSTVSTVPTVSSFPASNFSSAQLPVQNNFVSSDLKPVKSIVETQLPIADKVIKKPQRTKNSDPIERRPLAPEMNSELDELKAEYSKLKDKLAKDKEQANETAAPAQAYEQPKTMREAPLASSGRSASVTDYNPRVESVVTIPAGGMRSESSSSSSETPKKSMDRGQLDNAAASQLSANAISRQGQITLTGQSRVYQLTSDDLEIFKTNPAIIMEKLKQEGMPEVVSISDGKGGIKYLRAIYTLNEKNEKKLVELKEMDKSELCKTRLVRGHCEVSKGAGLKDLKKEQADKKQLYKVKDLEKILHKSTQGKVNPQRGDEKS